METREKMVIVTEGGRSGKSGSNLTETIGSPVREPQGKLSQRSCLSPDSYSRDRAELVMDESTRTNLCGEVRSNGIPSSGERHRSDHHHKNGSSSENESDFYEEIDVSCTPESMDYPTSKGGSRHQRAFVWVETIPLRNRLCNQRFKRALRWCRGCQHFFLIRWILKCATPETLFWLTTTLLRCCCCRAVSLH